MIEGLRVIKMDIIQVCCPLSALCVDASWKEQRMRKKHAKGWIGNGVDMDYFVAGLQGNLTAIPEGYSISFTVSALLGQGIRGAMYKWGVSLQTMYDTKKIPKDEDTIVKYLGYWTDNGSFLSPSSPFSPSLPSPRKIIIDHCRLYWYIQAGITTKDNL